MRLKILCILASMFFLLFQKSFAAEQQERFSTYERQQEKIHELSHEFEKLFKDGLIQEYGQLVGDIIIEVYEHHGLHNISESKLREKIVKNSKDIDYKLKNNVRDGSEMILIRVNIIASAKLKDLNGLLKWTNIAINNYSLCQNLSWTRTEEDWKWILDNPEKYILFANAMDSFRGN